MQFTGQNTVRIVIQIKKRQYKTGYKTFMNGYVTGVHEF